MPFPAVVRAGVETEVAHQEPVSTPERSGAWDRGCAGVTREEGPGRIWKQLGQEEGGHQEGMGSQRPRGGSGWSDPSVLCSAPGSSVTAGEQATGQYVFNVTSRGDKCSKERQKQETGQRKPISLMTEQLREDG